SRATHNLFASSGCTRFTLRSGPGVARQSPAAAPPCCRAGGGDIKSSRPAAGLTPLGTGAASAGSGGPPWPDVTCECGVKPQPRRHSYRRSPPVAFSLLQSRTNFVKSTFHSPLSHPRVIVPLATQICEPCEYILLA